MMKTKIFRFLSLICVSVLVFSACQKEFSVENGVPVLTTYGFSYRANDTAHAGCVDTAYKETIPSGSGTAYTLFLQGTDGSGSSIEIALQQATAITTGTYTNSQGLSMTFTNPNGVYTTAATGTTVTLVINAITDTSFDVSFNGTLINSVSQTARITQGQMKGLLNQRTPCGGTSTGGGSTGGGGTGGGGTTTPPVANNTWLFSQGSNNFSGTISQGTLMPNTSVDLLGTNAAGQTFGLSIPISGATPVVGTFAATQFVLVDVTNPANSFAAGSGLGNISVTVTSYDATTKVIKGTFSGQATSTTGLVAITNGGFSATLQ
jgi:hypothetical protein